MESRFGGKTVWLTGADTTVGKAVAEAFLREGASLLLSGVEEPHEELLSIGTGGAITTYPRNPVDEEEAENALSLVDRLDIAVAATRFIRRSSLTEVSAEEFDRVIDENLTAAWCALRGAAYKMGRDHPGAMLVLSSIHGEKPSGAAPLFSIANGGLNMLMREAAQDLGRLGFRVNLLRYGPLPEDTPLLQSELANLYFDPEQRVPRGRAGTPDEIAKAALFLCGDDASFVNGAALTVDGGFLGYYLDGDSRRRWDIGYSVPAGGDAYV